MESRREEGTSKNRRKTFDKDVEFVNTRRKCSVSFATVESIDTQLDEVDLSRSNLSLKLRKVRAGEEMVDRCHTAASISSLDKYSVKRLRRFLLPLLFELLFPEKIKIRRGKEEPKNGHCQRKGQKLERRSSPI